MRTPNWLPVLCLGAWLATVISAVPTWSLSDKSLTVTGAASQTSSFDSSQEVLLTAADRLKVSFQAQLKDGTAKAVRAHQALLVLTHETTQTQIIRTFDSSKQGKYSLSYKPKGPAGLYRASIVLGTFAAPQGLEQPLPPVRFVNTGPTPEPLAVLEPKPEIEHRFRPPQKEPWTILSLLATAVCVAPLAGLLAAWQRLGANTKHLGSPVSYAYAGCLLAYGCFYVLFWATWNVLEALTYGSVLSLILLVVGRYALLEVANQCSHTD
ncbi:proteasome regulatory particle base subunit [Dimargaris xerosporica]|nr:proteasome regulatory particle base subunit [Dimargaris xerosporica]